MVIPLLTVVVAIGCGGSSAKAPVQLSGKTNNHGTKVAVDGLGMEQHDYYFAPTFVTAASSQKFSVEISNQGHERHTFTSPAMGVDLELAAGERRTITLTAPPAGQAEFYCRFHQGLGMQGAVYVR